MFNIKNTISKTDKTISDKLNKHRKILSNVFLFLIPTVLITLFLFKIYSNNYAHFAIEQGELGYKLIILMLFLTPLSKIFSKSNFLEFLSRFRKELGMLSFWALTIHLTGTFIDLNLLNSPNQIIQEKYLLFGLLAYLGIFILGITSNKFSMKLFKKKWFLIHKALYLVFLLAIIHVILIKGDIFEGFVFIIFIILKLYVYFKFKKDN